MTMRNLFVGEDLNSYCIAASGGKENFPCDVDAPIAVSVAIGGGGLALLFVFYLMSAVSPSIQSPSLPLPLSPRPRGPSGMDHVTREAFNGNPLVISTGSCHVFVAVVVARCSTTSC